MALENNLKAGFWDFQQMSHVSSWRTEQASRGALTLPSGSAEPAKTLPCQLSVKESSLWKKQSDPENEECTWFREKGDFRQKKDTPK